MPLQKLRAVAIFAFLYECGFLHRDTNSAQSRNKIKFAFHFVERNNKNNTMTMKMADLCNALPSELSSQLEGDNVVSS